MKIGDEVYIHGYVDEIRDDTIIIRNEGGYFGTSKREIRSEPVWSKSEYPLSFSTHRYVAVMHDDEILIVDKENPCTKVIVEHNWDGDRLWK